MVAGRQLDDLFLYQMESQLERWNPIIRTVTAVGMRFSSVALESGLPNIREIASP